MVEQAFYGFVRNAVGVGVKMNKKKCPFCEMVHTDYEFLEGCVGKRYLGVIQLFCPTCGVPFEVRQDEFKPVEY